MGKQHGTLAKAGKVRKQTPKVAKQDKPRKPRGRAFKHLFSPAKRENNQTGMPVALKFPLPRNDNLHSSEYLHSLRPGTCPLKPHLPYITSI